MLNDQGIKNTQKMTTWFMDDPPFYRRALRCVRNEIHSHLFVASILHNFCWLIWYGAVVYRGIEEEHWTVS